MVGDLLEHDDAIRATAGTAAAYFCYPIRPRVTQTPAYFADVVKRAGHKAVVNPVADICPREFQEPRGARSLDRRTRLLTGRAFRSFQGEHDRELFAELGLSEAEIDRYVASGALVSAALPKAVIANKRQLVSSPVTDIRRHMEHET